MKRLPDDPLPASAAWLEPNHLVWSELLRTALLEDIGHGNDLTTDAIVEPLRVARAVVAAREPGIVAGIEIATSAFHMLDTRVTVDVRISDGHRAAPGDVIAAIAGPARPILTGERTMLNVLSRLCGIATATREMVDLVAGTRARVVCTRKTTPGLRALEKYAVRCGGGSNHRFGLDDAVLIKDNHLALAGSAQAAVAAVRARVGFMVKIEVEVDTLDQLREVLEQPVDAVLLDNMTPAQLTEAVGIVAGRVLTEASGGVRPDTIAEIARTGVDLISVGYLTHGAPSLDLGLDIEV
jgi:nicotinate-nucleotide pyrophosphorylase (carboxylating)